MDVLINWTTTYLETKVYELEGRLRFMGNLEDISSEYLRETLHELEGGEAIKRLMVAIAYKEIDDLTQNRAAEIYGYSSGWASVWFRRLERLETEPYEDVLYDEDRSGRPPKLTEEERNQFRTTVQDSPKNAGFDAPTWTVSLADQYLQDTFDVEYSDRHVRRLMREDGLF